MEKLGWGSKEAREALAVNNFDVSKAAEYLDAELEQKEKVIQLSKDGFWTLDAARAALSECDGNSTAAAQLLETEEASINAQFDKSVADMTEKGWDEVNLLPTV
jgi:hypothetical protein